MIQIDHKPHTIDLFYDVDWKLLELRHRERPTTECSMPKPANLEEMTLVASNCPKILVLSALIYTT